jgi:Protein of unknown function (DUF2855)
MPALETSQSDITTTNLVDTPTRELEEGQVCLALKRFSLTANNVTYAVFGRAMRYWDFFPAQGEGAGQVPVWGFGEVIQSRAAGILPGTKVYGYFPPSDTLIVEPAKASSFGFSDAAPHRQALAPVYNRYEIVPDKDVDTQNREALLKPLFITGFLLDDWIASENGFGASRVIASSASSKTALSMAACLKRRDGFEVVGLTSQRSKAFVEASGYYDLVVTYDDLAPLGDVPSVYVDFAGDGALTRNVHRATSGFLKASVAVGGAHWDAERGGSSSELVGPKPELFFAPTHVARLGAAWGAAEFSRAVDAALSTFVHDSRGWLKVHEAHGLPAAVEAWQRLVQGTVPPDEGLIITL